MNMNMRCARLNRVFLLFRTLKPLVKIPGLGDEKRNPVAALRFCGENVIGCLRLKRRANGMNLISIFLAGLSGPIMGVRIAAPQQAF